MYFFLASEMEYGPMRIPPCVCKIRLLGLKCLSNGLLQDLTCSVSFLLIPDKTSITYGVASVQRLVKYPKLPAMLTIILGPGLGLSYRVYNSQTEALENL